VGIERLLRREYEKNSELVHYLRYSKVDHLFDHFSSNLLANVLQQESVESRYHKSKYRNYNSFGLGIEHPKC
jgi:hypothetical protein